MSADLVCIRRGTSGDGPAITRLLNEVFTAADPEFRRLDAAWWRWKYETNPAGSHNLVLEDASGAMIGHYGGVPLAMRAFGGDVTFGQNCDSATDPRVRRGLRNPGAFVRIGQAYVATFGRRDADAVMYGLPTIEHYRIGARYLDYWMLRSQMLLVCRDPSRLPPWAPEVHAIPVAGFDAESDELARRLDPAHPCAARRDAAFLNWRFRDHHERPYRMAVARPGEGGRLRGHVAYRDGRFGGRAMGLIADWFVDPADDAAGRTLLRWATERAAQSGQRECGFLCPTSSIWFARFQEWGFEVDLTPYVLVIRSFDRRFQPGWMREHWYYTLADFDVA
jgi:hypothetical protein